ncbi:unnamed protein product [Notodromas monacha]|uniref:Eukaryotic translation initiation factor 3 subunit C n=1 Tax=Notodromas monacha TaxID=399045 RepID=A0A7R9BGN2_9CRUS|nr:unnamed protein product [Notodromas monacha]CAG0914274.1 unnamed protein product [Notodromas monacha]
MSRFFATGGSDTESDSSENGEDIIPKKPDLAPAYAFSDEEEDVKRVVRSAKDKRYEELSNIIRQIKNYKKIGDISSLQTGFEELTKAYTKALPIMIKEESTSKPKFYLRCLIDIEDCVNATWKDKKSLSKTNTKALVTLRQKIRKYNKDFEDEILALRADTEEVAVEDDAEADVEKDSDAEDGNQGSEALSRGSFLHDGISSGKDDITSGSKRTEKQRTSDDEEEDDDEDSVDWGSDSSETDSSSDDEGKYESMVDRFLKKNTQKEEEDKKQKRERKKQEKERAKRVKRDEEDEDMDEGWTQVKGGGAISAEKPKMFAKDAEITHALVLKKLIEIVAARGKKGTDRQEQVALLTELRAISESKELGPAMKAKIDFAIISALFDYNAAATSAMKEEYWEKVLKKIREILSDLSSCEDLTVGEHILEENESFEKTPYKIRGCIMTVCERMDDEFNKLLKDCDAHGPEYVKRLKDEKSVCDIFEHLQRYMESRESTPSDLCRVYLRRVEHLYYKFDPTVFTERDPVSRLFVFPSLAAEERNIVGSDGSSLQVHLCERQHGSFAHASEIPQLDNEGDEEQPKKETSLGVMDHLCKFIYAKDNTDRLRTRAILCHIYHHALHDNWYEARDLMLMSHLQDTIQHSDPPTQILYNRTMVQVGLCSFRHSKIKDAHDALLDIQSGGRAKELLAQGLLLQRQMERSSEQEKIEKQRQMPFHMHINLELLECVYLVSAMLMEIPYMAAHEFNARRRLISKSFHHQLKVSARQAVEPGGLRYALVQHRRRARYALPFTFVTALK